MSYLTCGPLVLKLFLNLALNPKCLLNCIPERRHHRQRGRRGDPSQEDPLAAVQGRLIVMQG